MVLYNFKQESLLNKPIVRITNAVILFLFCIILCSTTFYFKGGEIGGEIIALTLVYVVLSTMIGLATILRKNKWIEIDRKEAKNKESFIIQYYCVSTALSFIVGLFIIKTYLSYQAGGQYYWYFAIIGYLIFNRINLCSLFNFNDSFGKLFPLYDDKELNVIKHVLARDYNIFLDELI